MALTVLDYIAAMEQRQRAIAPKLGMWLQGSTKELRVALTLANAMTAVCMNMLVAKGVCTDAELAALFDNAAQQAFGDLPPPAPSGPPTGP